MDNKILLLGANGLIGYGITKYLFSKKVNLIAAVRTKKNKFSKNINFYYYNNLEKIKSFENIEKIIKLSNPDFIINCAGITKHIKKNNNKILNIELPKFIIKIKKKYKFRFIHITTDCVFDGKKGDYKESSITNAKDIYGNSKAIADKFLIKSRNAIILRTSTLGFEIKSKNGLLEWFLSKKKMCYGFKNAYFSGLTTLELAKIIYKFVLKKQLIKRGLYNLSGPKINKFELLNIIKDIYNKDIDILEENQFRIDRSLNSNKFIKLTKYKKKSWKKMFLEYKKFHDKQFI